MGPVIKIDHLTKDFGGRCRVFDASFEIVNGEVFGFLGPNGVGKTTTIRKLLGFIKPDKGQAIINGKPTWTNAHIVNADIGYLPGEINFPEKTSGMEFIKWMAELRGTKNLNSCGCGCPD